MRKVSKEIFSVMAMLEDSCTGLPQSVDRMRDFFVVNVDHIDRGSLFNKNVLHEPEYGKSTARTCI